MNTQANVSPKGGTETTTGLLGYEDQAVNSGMMVEEDKIIKAPEGLVAIFLAKIPNNRHCIIFSPKKHLKKIEKDILSDNPLDLSSLSLQIAIGVDDSFKFYQVISGCRMKNNWLVSTGNKDDDIAICFISNRHVVFPEKEECKKILHSIL